MSSYQPTQHDGLKKDGTPDKRVAQHSDNTSSHNTTHSSSGGGPARNPDGTFASASDSSADYDRSESHAASSGAKHVQHNTGEDIYKPTEHGGLKKDGTRDHRVKDENVTEEAFKYHPTEHEGLKKDGTRDKRVGHRSGDDAHAGANDSDDREQYQQQTQSVEHEDQEEYVEDAGDESKKHMQHNVGEDIYKPTEHHGLKKDGTRDHRVKDSNVTA
ncbi:hypothetical protein HDU87_006161 [Geranomyces variabilis]|uniref:Uncharacterized protein n=1 Tax=Geranomyces variabilis TaxID=109894 RepID=A0AAD5XNM6_9FUNG|nr:hypothetical protein HDU87_006161 [Geranomyces variabilis]